jgi:hypothetical protein
LVPSLNILTLDISFSSSVKNQHWAGERGSQKNAKAAKRTVPVPSMSWRV